jgi:hypothetical protein
MCRIVHDNCAVVPFDLGVYVITSRWRQEEGRNQTGLRGENQQTSHEKRELGAGDERSIDMIWLKSCPRCRGDLFMDSDYYGRFVSCIQCGATLDKRTGRSERALQQPSSSGRGVGERLYEGANYGRGH